MSGVQYYQDKSNEWRWRILSPNGHIIADSGEGYHNRADCEAGYDAAMRITQDD